MDYKDKEKNMLIFSRESNADKISEELLEKAIKEFPDGWGLAWFDTSVEKMHFQKEIGSSANFIEHYRRKESSHWRVVATLRKTLTGDNGVENKMPYFIPDVGALFIDASGVDPGSMLGISYSDLQSKYKSLETYIYELFDDWCLVHKSFVPISKWKGFIKSTAMPEGCKMVLMLLDGSILYSNSEDGFYFDKSKIWFSNIVGQNEYEVEMTDDLMKVKSYLDEHLRVGIEDLEDLNIEQLVHLCETYGYQMAELMKSRETGYDKQVMIEHGLMEDTNDDEVKCIDCDGPASLSDFQCIVGGREEYICQDCFMNNGPTTGFPVKNLQKNLFDDFEPIGH